MITSCSNLKDDVKLKSLLISSKVKDIDELIKTIMEVKKVETTMKSLYQLLNEEVNELRHEMSGLDKEIAKFKRIDKMKNNIDPEIVDNLEELELLVIKEKEANKMLGKTVRSKLSLVNEIGVALERMNNTISDPFNRIMKANYSFSHNKLYMIMTETKVVQNFNMFNSHNLNRLIFHPVSTARDIEICN